MKNLLKQLALIIVFLSTACAASVMDPAEGDVLAAEKKANSMLNNRAYDSFQGPKQVTMDENNTPCCGNTYFCKSCCTGEVSCNPEYRRNYYPSCKEFWNPSYETLSKSDNDSFICRCRPAYGCMPSTWPCICSYCTYYNRRLLW